jgi:hypothetical protein
MNNKHNNSSENMQSRLRLSRNVKIRFPRIRARSTGVSEPAPEQEQAQEPICSTKQTVTRTYSSPAGKPVVRIDIARDIGTCVGTSKKPDRAVTQTSIDTSPKHRRVKTAGSTKKKRSRAEEPVEEVAAKSPPKAMKVIRRRNGSDVKVMEVTRDDASGAAVVVSGQNTGDDGSKVNFP